MHPHWTQQPIPHETNPKSPLHNHPGFHYNQPQSNKHISISHLAAPNSPVDKKRPREVFEATPLTLEPDPVATPQRWCVLAGSEVVLKDRRGPLQQVPALDKGKQDGIILIVF